MSGGLTTIGVLGGTGPAGTAVAARLASVGYPVIIGSRSADRAEDKAREIREAWPSLSLDLRGGSNYDAAACEVIVLATPWDSAATTAKEH
ncbi:MAG: NAD(P)-binding domain-containing protein [Actinomycetota bacterium]